MTTIKGCGGNRLLFPRAGKNGALLRVLVLSAIAFFVFTSPLTAGVEKVEGGIRFSYYDPDAGQVNIAGTINGWSTDATPLTRGDDGYWSVVMKLDAGEHEYKFVVDGAWVTDPDNPSTKPDPYGGANSLLTLNSKGEIVYKGTDTPTSNTPLNALIHLGGRYLMRAYTFKDIEEDPRWRMQRPEQNVDLNFRVTINQIVQGYFRLRVDSSEDVLQPNNISAFLEDAHIRVEPEHFTITGYYNKEILGSSDPLGFYGDNDLAGTIFDDHLDEGKGTSGLVIESSQAGFDFELFAANVHDYDIYNSPDLYDNTGTDLFSVRASRAWKNFRFGGNFFMRRNLWWLDFTSLVGSDPSDTGIPRLDDYIDKTGDASDWFEFEDKSWYTGADVRVDLYDGKLVPKLEYLQGKLNQGIVTGNNSDIDLGNAPIDVPTADRNARIIFGGVRNTMIDRLMINLEHTSLWQIDPWEDESFLMPSFLPEVDANKQIRFTSVSEPVDYTHNYSELEFRWTDDKIDARLWLQRNLMKWDALGDATDLWRYDWSLAAGLAFSPFSRLGLDLEGSYRSIDGRMPTSLEGTSTFETILRGDYSLTEKLSAIFDLLIMRYVVSDGDDEIKETFFAPFAGFEYRPMHKVRLTLAYGIDPLDFAIDYSGRRTGRWNFMNEYMWDHPGSTVLDAEQALEDRRSIVLRALFNF